VENYSHCVDTIPYQNIAKYLEENEWIRRESKNKACIFTYVRNNSIIVSIVCVVVLSVIQKLQGRAIRRMGEDVEGNCCAIIQVHILAFV
jgi:hypothetical protein